MRHNVRRELLEQPPELVEVERLRHYPGNARLHDDELLDESLSEHGQYQALRVQRSTGYVLMGNGTYDAALAQQWTHVLVSWLDCDDATARKLVLIDNASSDRAKNDPGDLAHLLAELEGDYRGTGFDRFEHERLIAFNDTPLSFEPDESGGATRLDRRSVTDCPACGHTFTPQTRSVIEP